MIEAFGLMAILVIVAALVRGAEPLEHEDEGQAQHRCEHCGRGR